MRVMVSCLVCCLGTALVFACNAKTGSDQILGGAKRFEAVTPVAPVDPDAAAEGTSLTFTDLYTEYFSANGVGTCAGNGTCHASASEPGAAASGFICGNDKAECRATLLSSPLGMVVPGNADGSYLVSIIRHTNASGSVEGRMPKTPYTYSFTTNGMNRIRGWIAAGANDD